MPKKCGSDENKVSDFRHFKCLNVVFLVFWKGGKTYNPVAPAAGIRHLCTSMTVFLNFSTWAIFFRGGGGGDKNSL